MQVNTRNNYGNSVCLSVCHIPVPF